MKRLTTWCTRDGKSTSQRFVNTPKPNQSTRVGNPPPPPPHPGAEGKSPHYLIAKGLNPIDSL